MGEAEEQEREKLGAIRQQEAALAAAKTKATLAKWRRLQVGPNCNPNKSAAVATFTCVLGWYVQSRWLLYKITSLVLCLLIMQACMTAVQLAVLARDWNSC